MVNGVSEHSYLMPVTQLRETHSFENIHQGLISSILPQYATHTYCALHTHIHTHAQKWARKSRLGSRQGHHVGAGIPTAEAARTQPQKKCQQGAGRELTILARKTQHESGRGGRKTKTSSIIWREAEWGLPGATFERQEFSKDNIRMRMERKMC